MIYLIKHLKSVPNIDFKVLSCISAELHESLSESKTFVC